MTYPNSSSIDSINLKNLNSNIKWTAYLGQAFAPGILQFQEMNSATSLFLFNNALTLNTLSPYSQKATLPKHPVNTNTIIKEPFRRFGDSAILDFTDVITACGVDQLAQQGLSIAVRILRELEKQCFQGDGTGANLNSFINRADTSIDAAGALSLALLYQLKYSVTPSENSGLGFGGNAWFSNSRGFRALLTVLGTRSSKLEWKMHPVAGVSFPYVLGMPWIISEHILTTTNRTTILVMNLDSVKILYASSAQYPANERGIMNIIVPPQASVSELGMMVMGIFAIANLLGAIAKLINVTVPL